jgi:L-rhamnonate dehydratase
VEVRCADGEAGIGVAHGGPAACFVAEHALAPLVVGRDSADVEELWERMLLASALYGSGGVVLSAISGVDLALWDLRAKRAGVPVFELLRPGASPRVSLYATGPRPDVYERDGFVGAKVSLPHGPAAGERGLQENVEYIVDRRRELDRSCFLALDCFMALDEPYARRLLDRLRGVELRWLEEPFPPWELAALARLRDGRLPLAAGEHHDNVGLERLVVERLVDLVQPELTWCGGLTPALRLVEAAHAVGVLLVPHCGGAFAQHLVAASPASPFAEFLIGSADGERAVPTFAALVRGEPLPEHGVVELRSDPGFGVTLAEGLVRPFARD